MRINILLFNDDIVSSGFALKLTASWWQIAALIFLVVILIFAIRRKRKMH